MKSFVFIFCIISLKAFCQDCHIPAINYNPKQVIGNYSLYQFTPSTVQKTRDSVLLITSMYDSIELSQIEIVYANLHSMAGAYRDPGIDKIKLDTNGNVVCHKKYTEGQTYNGKYKYIGLEEYTYNHNGYLLSESVFASANIPVTFVYTDSSFDQVIKQNYSHRASPDCISRYHYTDSLISIIENYRDGSLLFTNKLLYKSGNIVQAKAYKPDGTLFSIIEFSYSAKGFTQTLYYVSEHNKVMKKEDDSYYWKYTKEKGEIVELEYGKNGTMIDKNKYVYDKNGKLVMINMYDKKSLMYIHKYYYD